MYHDLSKRALTWINSNLRIFLGIVKISSISKSIWKPAAELFFVSIFKDADKELTDKILNKLENMQIRQEPLKNISQKEIGRLILMILLNKRQEFTEEALNGVKLLPYREQLEFSMYLSLLNNSTLLILSDNKPIENTLIHQNLSSDNFEIMDIYQLTHEVMYLTMLGRNKHQLLLDNLEYLNSTIHSLLEKMIAAEHIDLIAELILVSQLLNIDIEDKIKNKSHSILSSFVEENANKTGKDFLSNNQFNKIYHQMLVISLLR